MSRRGRWITLAVGGVLAALFVGRWVTLFTTDRLWADALGVAQPQRDIAALRLALGGAGLLIAAVWCIGNVLLVYRQIGSVQVPRRLGNLEIVETVPRRYLLLGALGIGAILALALSHDTGAWWTRCALSATDVVVGVQDPILHRDVGYYLFRLPWARVAHGYGLLLVGVVLVLVALLYGAIGAIRWSERRLVCTDLARRHLAALLALLALALAWGYRLEPAELVGGLHDVPYDAILTGVRIPVAGVLAVLALIVAAASLLWLWIERAVMVGTAWLVLIVVSFAGHYVLPGFVAAARGSEGRRSPDLEAASAGFRRSAFALGSDTVRVDLAVPDSGFLARHAAALARIPVWDSYAASQALRLDGPREGARSADVPFEATLAAYPDARGRAVPVLLAVREIDTARARAADRDVTWERRHGEPFGYSVGAVAIQAAAVSARGLPLYIPRLERPDSAVPTPGDLELRNDTVWFAPGLTDFALAPPDHVAGVAAGGLARRLALAWTLQAPRLLTSASVARTTVVLAHRAISARLARYAPFARFGAAYPVVADGALLWLATGYVWSEAYPLSRRVAWRGNGVRYLHGGLLGVVNAHSGATQVYLLPDADPLSRAWAALLPGLVQPAEAIPGTVLPHVRYPDEPFWWFGTAPGDSVGRLRLRAVDEVQIEPRVAAIVDGTMHGGVPRLTVLDYPQPYTLPGPSELGREFRAEVGPGAAVEGTVRLVPFADGAIGVETFYADSGVLTEIVLGWHGALGRGRSLEQAAASVRHVAPLPTLPGSPDALVAAREAFRRLDSARAKGDWRAFGEAWDALRRALFRGRDTSP
jgi:uncharacterized membrane protein (UPF0182 family)